MNLDVSYCEGVKPFDKCKTCKRFIANRTPDDIVWMIEPCEYWAKEE